MKRGELFWAALAPRSGSEQAGRRPVIVVSHDGFNSVPTWRSIIVVPITASESQSRRGPTAIMLPKGSGGLSSTSYALCHQVTTLDRRELESRIGALDPPFLAAVENGLLIALGILRD